jgi:hypothetical protein
MGRLIQVAQPHYPDSMWNTLPAQSPPLPWHSLRLSASTLHSVLPNSVHGSLVLLLG